MPKLPQVSGNDVVRLLGSLGYQKISQSGSHLKMRKTTGIGQHTIVVPLHKVVAKGTLNDILNKLSLWNNVSKDKLISGLK